MDAIENAAYVSVGRACGFAGLAIFCVIFGLSYEPALAARVGGELCLGVALILTFCAWRARRRPYKNTELWIIVDKDKRPPAAIAQQVVGVALREAYIWFAQSAAMIALVLLASAVVLQLAGVEGLGGRAQSLGDRGINPDPVMLLPTGPGFDFMRTP